VRAATDRWLLVHQRISAPITERIAESYRTVDRYDDRSMMMIEMMMVMMMMMMVMMMVLMMMMMIDR
jgi:hypothetical protein